MKTLSKLLLCGSMMTLTMGWGFFGHQKINRLSVFILPAEMIGFYKKNIIAVSEMAVNPDRRRYAVPDEGPKHFIDLDVYGDSSATTLPRYWGRAVEQYGEDSLGRHGILPWHIYRMFRQLKDAFMIRDPKRILRVSAELGHYIADAHVPLHTTSNYDGQKTGQSGIHAFWESRLPELYFNEYDFLVGKAEYISNIQLAAWDAVAASHEAKDSVLKMEMQLFEKSGETKFSFETKGKRTIKVISTSYAHKYHVVLQGMVERRMRASIKMIGDVWYTAWIDAGQPDLKSLIGYTPTEEELKLRVSELNEWKKHLYPSRDHEEPDDP